MTATDRLRALLDERGVKYGSGFGGDTLWTGRDGIEWRWDKQENTIAMYSHTITPEQAVEATLGRGECRIVKKKFPYSEVPMCSECGRYWLEDSDNFCPNCGRRVVK